MKEKRWPNVIILTLLFFLAAVWINHHLNTSKLLMIAAAIPVLLQIFNWVISNADIKEENPFSIALKKIVNILLKKSVIITLSIIMLVVALFVSSITIKAINTESEYKIEILTKKENQSQSPTKHFQEYYQKLMLTSPFGRIYYINIPGFHVESIKVNAIKGTKLELPKSFRALPSLLLRLKGPNPELYSNDTLFVVQEADTILKVAHEEGKLAFQIGRTEAIEDEMKSNWNDFLTGQGVDEGTRSNLILKWSKPIQLDKLLVLNPKDTLSVFIRNHIGIIKEEATFKSKTYY